MGEPTGNGSGSTPGSTNVPQDVLNQLWQQSNGDVGTFQQLVNQWVSNNEGMSAIYNAIPPYIRQNGIQIDAYNWLDPTTGSVWRLNDVNGKPVIQPLSDADSKRFLAQYGGAGGVGGTGGGGGYNVTQDPRYWDLQFGQLQQQYVNAGLDAESARRQALATLLTNRNAQQVNLAGEEANAAKTAADYAANPRDAVAELMYRNAVGGSTPFGDTNNPQFPQYQTALQDKFQSMFGGAQDAFKRAQDFLNQPPPSEYLQPSYTGPGSQYLPKPQPFAHGGTINLRIPSRTRRSSGNITGGGGGSGIGQFSHGGMIDVTPPKLSFGYSPSTSEGGTNMNINEPSVLIGMHSGHAYATMAEHAPEQLIIKPLPSVQKARKQYDAMTKQMADSTQGAKRNDAGGTITYGTDPSQFVEELRKNLLNLSPGFGGVGAAGAEGKLPSLRLLAGAPANFLAEDPALQDYMLAGYSSMGIDPRTAMATIQKFTPNAPQNNIPRVVFT